MVDWQVVVMEHVEKPEGFFVPFHRSALEPILMGGVERSLFFLIWTIGIAIGLMQQIYWFIGVVFFVHMVLRQMTKADQAFFEIIKNSIHCKRCFW